jgi:hypothetical protein
MFVFSALSREGFQIGVFDIGSFLWVARVSNSKGHEPYQYLVFARDISTCQIPKWDEYVDKLTTL